MDNTVVIIMRCGRPFMPGARLLIQIVLKFVESDERSRTEQEHRKGGEDGQPATGHTSYNMTTEPAESSVQCA